MIILYRWGNHSKCGEEVFLFNWYGRPIWISSLRWRHNRRDSVSNHQPHDCLLKGLFRRRSKKTWKLRVTGLCAGNSPGTGEFPAQMASNAENVSIWWRHHVDIITYVVPFCERWSPDSYLGCRWDKRMSNVIESKVHVMWLAMLCQIIKTVLKMSVMHRNLTNVVSQVSIRIVRFNTSKPRQNGRHFVDDIIKFIFLN